MKRWIHSSDNVYHEGYLKTTKFNCPSIQTDEQRNALEALEIAIIEKFKQFEAMNDITLHLTSDSFWQGTIDEYPEGYYIQLYGTRSNFVAFVEGDHVIRKPRKLSNPIVKYEVEGIRGQVDYMSKGRRY